MYFHLVYAILYYNKQKKEKVKNEARFKDSPNGYIASAKWLFKFCLCVCVCACAHMPAWSVLSFYHMGVRNKSSGLVANAFTHRTISLVPAKCFNCLPIWILFGILVKPSCHFIFILRQGLTLQPWLVWNSRDVPASASWALGLKACATTAWQIVVLKTKCLRLCSIFNAKKAWHAFQ